jgi:UDP-N-acetylglucosamine acyltransferase
VEISLPRYEQQASSFEEAFFNSTDTYIHPTAVIGPKVILGNGVKIGPFCSVVGNVTIGDNTRLHPHVTIGFPGQVVGVLQSHGTLEIGSNCELREFVTIHAPRFPTGMTKIGNNCYLMNYVHIGHDCVVEDNVTMTNNVSLAGHTHIETRAVLMAGAVTHQFTRVGTFTAMAPFSGIRQDAPPYCILHGQPGAFYGLNLIGLKRNGFTRESINALKHVTKLFYQDKLTLDEIDTLAAHDQSWGDDEHVKNFLKFVKNSTRGVSRRCASDNKQQGNSESESTSW